MFELEVAAFKPAGCQLQVHCAALAKVSQVVCEGMEVGAFAAPGRLPPLNKTINFQLPAALMLPESNAGIAG
jgi:hypothetical protein